MSRIVYIDKKTEDIKENNKGLFIQQDEECWIGIDNTTGEAWTEEFDTKEDCISWLNGEFEISDYWKVRLFRRCKDKKVKVLLEETIQVYEKYKEGIKKGETTNYSVEEVEGVIRTFKDILELLELIDEDMAKE